MTDKVVDSLLDEVWSAFQLLVRTDADAADLLYQYLIDSNEMICGCSPSLTTHRRGSRFYTCHYCKNDFWLTSGTALDGVVKLRAWLAAIFFKDHGVAMSAARLSRLVAVAPSTALNIHKTLALVVCDEMSEAVEVSASWFSQVIFKRSTQTPAQCHPRAELVEPEVASSPLTLGPSSSVNLEQALFSFDFDLAPAKLRLAVSQFIGFIAQEFHGISRKCLQLYLASFWCTNDSIRWAPGSLLKACLSHAPIRQEQVKNFVSPTRVLIMLPIL
jgi:hypothetical protein